MTNQSDAGMQTAWAEQIKREAGRIAKSTLDYFIKVDKDSWGKLPLADRKQVVAQVTDEVVSAMYKLGGFMIAGAQEFVAGKVEQVTLKDDKDAKATLLIPVGDENKYLDQLTHTIGKTVVVALVNKAAYEDARKQLTEAVARDQMDWVNNVEEVPGP